MAVKQEKKSLTPLLLTPHCVALILVPIILDDSNRIPNWSHLYFICSPSIYFFHTDVIRLIALNNLLDHVTLLPKNILIPPSCCKEQVHDSLTQPTKSFKIYPKSLHQVHLLLQNMFIPKRVITSPSFIWPMNVL